MSRLRWVASLLLFTTACGTDYVRANEPQLTLIEHPEDPVRVRAAIVRALDDRDFNVTGENPGSIAATWDHDEETISVEVIYDGQRFEIRYVQSTGFDIVQQPGGELYVHEDVGKIIKKLGRRVEHELEEANKSNAVAVAPAPAPQPQPGPPAPGGQPASGVTSGPSWQQWVPPVSNLPIPAPGPITVGGSHTHKEQSQTLKCCINGSYYQCPNQQAFQQCFTDGGASCTRVPAKDGEC